MNNQVDQLAQMKMQCQQLINQPVHLQVHGEQGYNGIIEQVDDEHVYLLVPVNEHGQYMDLGQMMNNQENQPMMRQFYPYYQPYPYYGYPRPYGWNRLVLPLAALTALAVLF